nr:Putative inner membrane protein [Salmonella sp. NCTC 7297]
MEYLARLNIVTMLMSTTFWINLAVVFFVTPHYLLAHQLATQRSL